MNIDPQPEILKIGQKKYRVMKLDQTQYKKQQNEKNSRNMISYSGGGYLENEPSCALDREEKLKQREQIIEQEKQLIKQYKNQNSSNNNTNNGNINNNNQQKQKSSFTHFVGVPLNKPILMAQIQDYLEDDMDSQFIYDCKKAHITLLMLNLPNDKAIQKAQQCMKKIEPKIKSLMSDKAKEAKLHLKGLGFFGNSMKEARVLYLNVQESNRGNEIIEEMVDLVVKAFADQDLIDLEDLSHIQYNKASRMYELEQKHITLMKSKNQGQSFDISNIMKKHNNFELKNLMFDSIEISQMGQYQQNGYFKPLVSYQF